MRLRTHVVRGRVAVVARGAVRVHPRGRAHDRVRQAVAERDGWICQLCHEPIDPALRRPDPMALHVDHVEQLADGGSDAPSNLRATHELCHRRRHAG